MKDINKERLESSALAIANADAIMVGAGAGMGVDSGLPDFRGKEGFWRAYPMAKKLGKTFVQMATPNNFFRNPKVAWGFYGHRLNLYRETNPHFGFGILKQWLSNAPLGGFVYTSNVDGQFQKAGFSEDMIYECHGSIHHLQCASSCCIDIWSTDEYLIEVNNDRMEALSRLPYCDHCGRIARPNILMFNDTNWVSDRSDEQQDLWYDWLRTARKKNLVVIELGAGTHVPSVRNACQMAGGTLIRINPREYRIEGTGISLPMGALEALSTIDNIIKENNA